MNKKKEPVPMSRNFGTCNWSIRFEVKSVGDGRVLVGARENTFYK
jgi:hypothetical protein